MRRTRFQEEQLQLGFADSSCKDNGFAFKDPAFDDNKRLPVHRWVPWVAGYSAPFVADVLSKYVDGKSLPSATVLDPFAGVGTTLIEAMLHGCDVIGFELNPFAALAASVKLRAATLNLSAFAEEVKRFEQRIKPVCAALDECWSNGRDDFERHAPQPQSKPPQGFKSRISFYSPVVEKKVLHALDAIQLIADDAMRDFFRVAFGAVMVQFSNYCYGPSLGSRPGTDLPLIDNAPVDQILVGKLWQMHADTVWLQGQLARVPASSVHAENCLDGLARLPSESVDLLITSPPYSNNYHYIRNMRPHFFWLGFAAAPRDLERFEHGNFGKFWQTVREDKEWRLDFKHGELSDVIATIRRMNPDKGIYGGHGWANYATAYFNDCYRFLSLLHRVFKPKGVAVFVLGNSILQGIEIATDRFFAEIGESVGWRVEGVERIRDKRIGSSIIASSVRNSAPKHKTTLYESAVVLRK